MIKINGLTLSLPHKVCFENFSALIPHGRRIAIIGRNGAGKSTLLTMIRDGQENEISLPHDIRIGYVPQMIEDFETLSGGQRFNKVLSVALQNDPTLFLLDEPTNHLDKKQRINLMKMLKSYSGTLIMVTHDVELLQRHVDELWHIDRGEIKVFSGDYHDYKREQASQRASLEKEITQLHREEKNVHQAMMQEQRRAAKSRSKGEKSISQKKWPTVVCGTKATRGEETTGRKKNAITEKKQALRDSLASYYVPEVILPTFDLSAETLKGRTILSIRDGSMAYGDGAPVRHDIYLSIQSGERLAICGDNGAGKTTLVKAILQDPTIRVTGEWALPHRDQIGYLDQHYGNLSHDLSSMENLDLVCPHWNLAEKRRHLNDFLFRKNDEVHLWVRHLSGGEKARLSLALIAANPPLLLILDEITNNLDLETRDHVIQILDRYPGALIVISHDENFLTQINVEEKICL